MVSNMAGWFSMSYRDVILPIDELICFKMVKTTNQYYYNQLLTSPPLPTPPHAPHVSVASTSCDCRGNMAEGTLTSPPHSIPPLPSYPMQTVGQMVGVALRLLLQNGIIWLWNYYKYHSSSPVWIENCTFWWFLPFLFAVGFLVHNG